MTSYLLLITCILEISLLVLLAFRRHEQHANMTLVINSCETCPWIIFCFNLCQPLRDALHVGAALVLQWCLPSVHATLSSRWWGRGLRSKGGARGVPTPARTVAVTMGNQEVTCRMYVTCAWGGQPADWTSPSNTSIHWAAAASLTTCLWTSTVWKVSASKCGQYIILNKAKSLLVQDSTQEHYICKS